MKLTKAKRWFEKRNNAKKIDVKKSMEVYDTDFYVYYPSSEVDINEYTDDEGNINIDEIPEDQLIEFQCRYVTSGEYRDYCLPPPDTSFLNDDFIKSLKDMKKEELEERVADAVLSSLNATNSYNDAVERTVFHAIVDPKFQTVEQVRQIIPTVLLELIHEECTKFVDGSNLATV